MNDQAQGIGDQPVSEDEMAEVDQAADMFGQIAQPDVAQPGATVTPADPVAADPVQPAASDQPTVDPAAAQQNPADTPIADAINDQVQETPEGEQSSGGLAQPDAEAPVPAPDASSAPADNPQEPSADDSQAVGDDTPQPWTGEVEESSDQAQPSDTAPASPEIAPVAPAATEYSNADDTPAETQPETPEITSTHSKPSIQPVSHASAITSQIGSGNDDELLDVKQQALQELTPLVDTLNLPPEERFDTLMMIIRASDDKNLVKPAYEAANQISDQDKKARALLDVVNEVNYLTQNGPDSQKA